MKKLLKATMFCIGSMMLAACSSAAGSDSGDGNGGSSADPSVKTMPMACMTKDGVETEVVCDVAVSHVQVSQSALSFAIDAYLMGSVLPTVCGGYGTDPLLEDPQGFNGKVKDALSATVAGNGTGWSIESVSCEGSK